MEPGSMADVSWFLPKSALDDLMQYLRADGYTVLARVVRDSVLSLQPVEFAGDLAHGVKDEQDGGHYRLEVGERDLLFEHVVGPDGPKHYLFPADQRLFACHIEGEQFVLDEGPTPPSKWAFLGIRSCELAAINTQDRVFGFSDPTTMRCESEVHYNQTREQALIIVADCIRPAGTCFCVSMGTGPAARDGFDLAFTELREGFIFRSGSKKGEELLRQIPVRQATGSELELAELKLKAASEHMGRYLDTTELPQLLDRSLEHPQWDKVAQRCLSCGNCTMVCPTCFCSTVHESTDLSGKITTRTRQWEACYSHEFSYLTAGPVRHTIRGRYRHWMRHKLGTWHAQFGTSGCVGCGRCITWCPVGIDLTEESARIRESAPAATPPSRPPSMEAIV